jgi:hypothetical protein
MNVEKQPELHFSDGQELFQLNAADHNVLFLSMDYVLLGAIRIDFDIFSVLAVEVQIMKETEFLDYFLRVWLYLAELSLDHEWLICLVGPEAMVTHVTAAVLSILASDEGGRVSSYQHSGDISLARVESTRRRLWKNLSLLGRDDRHQSILENP